MKCLACSLLFITILGICHAQQSGQGETTGAQDMLLSDQAVASYSEKALQGDSSAASRLGQFYLAVHGDRGRAEHWYLIAAENGSADAQRTYATMILQDGEGNKVRAIFWLKKASENGDALARKELDRLKI
jgi:TPR repeat protein